jgi:hypothetical protein
MVPIHSQPGRDRLWRFWLIVLLETADLTSALMLSRATEGCSATGHSFALVRMVCSGHSQTGSFS